MNKYKWVSTGSEGADFPEKDLCFIVVKDSIEYLLSNSTYDNLVDISDRCAKFHYAFRISPGKNGSCFEVSVFDLLKHSSQKYLVKNLAYNEERSSV